MLSRLHGSRARAFLADCVTTLDPARLPEMPFYLGTALWSQRQAEPFALLLWHSWLRQPDGITWIEPAFAAEVEGLPETFREALQTRALQVANGEPDFGERERNSARLLLALLGDQRVVQVLRAKLAREGRLGPGDHRLLIHLDSDESIALYVESADVYLAEIRATSEDDDPNGIRRYDLISAIVLKQSDIRMFPCDRLREVVECALAAGDPLMAGFGLEWLQTVIADSLIPAACKAAYALHDRPLVDIRFRNVRLPDQTSLDALFDHFHRGDRYVRQFIVRQLAGRQEDAAIDFLGKLLDNPDFAGEAAEALGKSGSGRAVPFLIDAIEKADPAGLSEFARSLGVLGHPTAVPALGRALSRCIAARVELGNDWRRDYAEHFLLVSLGGLGGPALDLLRSHWDRIDHGAVVRALVARGGAAEIEFVLDALEEKPELVVDVVRCLGSGDPDWYLPSYVCRFRRPVGPHLDDERLLHRILDHVGATPTGDEVAAIARFRSPRARRYLREVAANDALPVESTPTSGVAARTRAVQLLVDLGDDEYVRRAVAEAVDLFMAAVDPDPRHFRDLPRSAIRERARELVVADPHPKWVRLLRWFAQPEDRRLFEDLERSSNHEIAEEAHEFLTWPGFLFDGP